MRVERDRMRSGRASDVAQHIKLNGCHSTMENRSSDVNMGSQGLGGVGGGGGDGARDAHSLRNTRHKPLVQGR